MFPFNKVCFIFQTKGRWPQYIKPKERKEKGPNQNLLVKLKSGRPNLFLITWG